MRRFSTEARHRWSVASRTIACTLGAYGLTSLATVTLSLMLARIGMTKIEAVTAATLASFAIFAAAAMAACHARSATRAWSWLLASSVAAGLVALLLLPGTKV